MQDLRILDFIPKANGSHWRMSRRKVRCLDLFFRAQSAVCGSCCLPAYSCQTLQPHWRQPASSSIHGILQARILEWVPVLFFHCTSSFSNFVNILFLFQSLFILLMLGPCCEWASSSCSCSAQASPCSSFPCFGAQALENAGFHSNGSQAIEHRLSSCGPWA